MEAHDSELRALCLTANGNLLATSSIKGTLLRVWEVSSSQCLYEFRRGVERANITSLAFSWDDQWLSCCSDKGTAHIFHCSGESGGESSRTSLSLSKLILNPSKSQPKSVCQVRGVPHPLACAFIGDVPNVLAVAGWDADGNGVLLLSEFAAHQEARRVAYHVLVKNSRSELETEEERRRRRARGWKPSVPETPNHGFGNLQISETQARQIVTEEHDDDDFCEVIVETAPEPIVTEDRVVPTTTITTTKTTPPAKTNDDAKTEITPSPMEDETIPTELLLEEDLPEAAEATQ